MEFSCAAVMTIHAQKDLMLGKAQPFNIGKAKTGLAGPVTPPLIGQALYELWQFETKHVNVRNLRAVLIHFIPDPVFWIMRV